jgi:hypothetical protein
MPIKKIFVISSNPFKENDMINDFFYESEADSRLTGNGVGILRSMQFKRQDALAAGP